MQYTDNYSLKKPQRGVDRANVDDLDDNFDVIDRALADDRQIGLLMYDSTATYNTGAIRGYENPTTHRVRAYRCLEDNVTGPWDATKWAQTTLAAEIEAGGGGGGSSTLAGLSDVDLDTPADGEVLTYDATEGKWVNAEGGSGGASELSDLDDVSLTTPTEGQILTFDGDEWVNTDAPDVDVTKTASGNPIEISDGANAPLVKCVTEIQGSQDLHGYDKPWVGGAGSNKWDEEWEVGAINGATGQPSEASTVIRSKNYCPISANATLYVKSPQDVYIYWYSSSSYGYISYNYVTKNTTITAPTNTSYFKIQMTSAYGTTYNNDVAINYPSTVTTYSPYSNICPITAYTEGKIVERGKNLYNPATETVSTSTKTNEMTVEPNTDYVFSVDVIQSGLYVKGYDNGNWVSIVSVYGVNKTAFNSGEYTRIQVSTYSSSYSLPTQLQVEKGSTATTYEPYVGNTHTTTYPSAIFRGSEDVVGGTETHDMPVIDLGDLTWSKSSTIQNAFIATLPYYKFVSNVFMLCSAYNYEGTTSTGTPSLATKPDGSFMAYYKSGDNYREIYFKDTRFTEVTDFANAVDGVQLAYELATPQTSSVTPTNLPIKSLNGYSHIESSTGDLEIEYITGKYQPLVDLISESSGGDSQHHYSTDEQVIGTWIDGKTLYEKTLTYNQSYTYSNSGWDEIPFTGVPTDIETAISLGIIGGDDDGMQFNDNRVRYMVDLSGSSPKIVAYSTQTNHSVTWITAIIRYTKSASQSRSVENLSKGGEVVDKVDEPLEEKKEEAKEPVDKTSLEPISEPLETKTDNLSKDEEKAEIEDESKEIEEVMDVPEEEPKKPEEPTEEEPVDPEPSKEEEADER